MADVGSGASDYKPQQNITFHIDQYPTQAAHFQKSAMVERIRYSFTPKCFSNRERKFLRPRSNIPDIKI